MKRAAVALAAFCLLVGLAGLTTTWEPHSTYVKARVVTTVAFLLFFLLMWYGNTRDGPARK